MKIAIGADHAGFVLKNEICDYLSSKHLFFKDFGTYSCNPIDYPVIAKNVALNVSKGHFNFGILVCGSGLGMSIAANRFKHVRAVSICNPYLAKLSRLHNDSNILCLGARVIAFDLAIEIIETWLNSDFLQGRHSFRIEQIDLDI